MEVPSIGGDRGEWEEDGFEQMNREKFKKMNKIKQKCAKKGEKRRPGSLKFLGNSVIINPLSG